jgi:hypothetical protein
MRAREGSINPAVPRTRSTLMLRLQYPGQNRQQTDVSSAASVGAME